MQETLPFNSREIAIAFLLLLGGKYIYDVYIRRSTGEELAEIKISLGAAFFNMAFSGLFILFFFEVYAVMGVARVPRENLFLYNLACFISADFMFYLSHRVTHIIPTLWRFHAFHHSAQFVNIQSHFRHSPHNVLISGILLFSFCWLSGLNFPLVASYFGFISLYQLLVHNKSVKWPVFLKYAIITPQTHRVHHQRSSNHRNFGGILCIWDIIFRTYESQEASNQEYGICGHHNFSKWGSIIDPRTSADHLKSSTKK